MTRDDLISLDWDESSDVDLAREWIKHATRDELKDVLREVYVANVEDLDKSELREELSRVYYDGCKGVEDYTDDELRSELLSNFL